MSTSHKDNDSGLTLSTDVLARRASASSPIVEKRRALLTSTRCEEKAAERRARHFATMQAESEESFEDEAIDPGRSPEDIAAAREAYGRLSPREQKVVRLHTEGWSFKEIGVATGSSGEYARQTYHGAIEQMRRMLK